MANIAPSDIHVRLLGLGQEQWRVAYGLPVGDGLYELLGPMPDGEQWQFTPGQVVECEEVVLFLGDYGLLACRALPPNDSLKPNPHQGGA